MTRKDYSALAGAIYQTRADLDTDSDALDAIDLIIEALADVLQWDNSNFDRERFYKAAGYGK